MEQRNPQPVLSNPSGFGPQIVLREGEQALLERILAQHDPANDPSFKSLLDTMSPEDRDFAITYARDHLRHRLIKEWTEYDLSLRLGLENDRAASIRWLDLAIASPTPVTEDGSPGDCTALSEGLNFVTELARETLYGSIPRDGDPVRSYGCRGVGDAGCGSTVLRRPGESVMALRSDDSESPMSLDELRELEKVPADEIVDVFENCMGPAATTAMKRAYSLGLCNGSAHLVSYAVHEAITGLSYEEAAAKLIKWCGMDHSGTNYKKAAELLFAFASELYSLLDLWPWEPQGSLSEWALRERSRWNLSPGAEP